MLGISTDVDEITRRALAKDPTERFATAREMALALDACVGAPMHAEIAGWMQEIAGVALRDRAEAVAAIERDATGESFIPAPEELLDDDKTIDDRVPPRATCSPTRARPRSHARSMRSTLSTPSTWPKAKNRSDARWRRRPPA